MKIAAVYSHLYSVEYLLVHRKALWQEVNEIVGKVEFQQNTSKTGAEHTKELSRRVCSARAASQLSSFLCESGWNQSTLKYWATSDVSLIRRTISLSEREQKKAIMAEGFEPVFSYNRTSFVKDRVALAVQFGKYAFVAYDLFVKHLAFYVGDKIDVGIEILPMKSLQKEMSSGVPYYEGELYNVIRQGRGVPAVPLVILGVEP